MRYRTHIVGLQYFAVGVAVITLGRFLVGAFHHSTALLSPVLFESVIICAGFGVVTVGLYQTQKPICFIDIAVSVGTIEQHLVIPHFGNLPSLLISCHRSGCMDYTATSVGQSNSGSLPVTSSVDN